MRTARLLPIVAASLTLMLSGTALSQNNAPAPSQPVDVRPPAPTDPGKPNVIVPYLLMFLLGAAAIGLAVMPSQRTHQD